MYRSVISWFVLFLLIGWVISINPQAREEATELWEEARPTVVAWKDKVIEAFQDFINNETDAQIDHEPVSPELNIDVISAFNHNGSVVLPPKSGYLPRKFPKSRFCKQLKPGSKDSGMGWQIRSLLSSHVAGQ